jgi:hypothetical protein
MLDTGEMLDQHVSELKEIIAGNDGRNAADRRFARRVDDLVGAVYDDIGEISDTSPRALFDLFVIKVLYVGRRSRDAAVIEYLGGLLDTYLYARELFPAGADGRATRMYFSDMLTEPKAGRWQNNFEAYRKYGDNALFISGVFPASGATRAQATRSVLRRRAARTIDTGYYVSTGKTMYRMAARQDLAAETSQRDLLEKLAEYFELYMDALTEMSERYILGFDMELIADKMLDAINRYRASGEEKQLENARRYAAILRIDRERFPAAFE